MHKWVKIVSLVVFAALFAACSSEDPDVRRGNLLYKNKQYDTAFKAYEQAVAKNPKNLDLVRQNFKNAYYYYGGSLEMGDSLDGAVKYYEKGFALDPSDAGMCDKLAKYYWDRENFEKAADYFQRLVELDGEAPDTDKKWSVMGEDYYALGYSQFENEKYAEAIDAFQNSIKVSPKGQFAEKAKSALTAAKVKTKK